MQKPLLAILAFCTAFYLTYSYMQDVRSDRTSYSREEPVATSTVQSADEIADEVARKVPMQDVVITSSGSFVLPIRQSWSTEKNTYVSGAIEYTEIDVFNDANELVFIVQSPVAVDAFPGTRVSERGYTVTKIGGGSSLERFVRTYQDEQVGGFVHYLWNGAGDFPGKSFEIFVPFRPGLYARSPEDITMQVGVPVAYKTKAAAEAARESIETMLSGIREK